MSLTPRSSLLNHQDPVLRRYRSPIPPGPGPQALQVDHTTRTRSSGVTGRPYHQDPVLRRCRSPIPPGPRPQALQVAHTTRTPSSGVTGRPYHQDPVLRRYRSPIPPGSRPQALQVAHTADVIVGILQIKRDFDEDVKGNMI